MKKIINTAPMAVITSLHTPLTVSLTTKVVNGTLTQAQDIIKNLWLPDRTIEPLFLVPVFSAYDPDKEEHIQATPSYTWYVNGVQVPASNPQSSDYSIVSNADPSTGIINGSLRIRKNVSYLTPETIKCVATYQGYTADCEELLTTENKPDAFYQVSVKTPPIVEFRPLFDSTTRKTFQAFVQHGQDALVWEDVIGKSINVVDLGSLTWSKSDSVFTATLPSTPKSTGGAALAGYTQDQSLSEDKTISTANSNIRVKDASYATADAFKSAMRGKVLFYELNNKTVNESFVEAMRKMTGFFWYLDGVLITSDTFGYVSGQGMESLVLDADYIDDAVVSVRLAVPVFTDINGDVIVTMPTAPNSSACAQSTLLWKWDDVDVMPIALGGSSVHQYSSQKVFNSVVRRNGKDLDSSFRSRIRAIWFTHDTDDSYTDKTYYGDSTSVTLPASALFRTGRVNVEVGLELYLLGHLHPTIDSNTGQYVVDSNTGEIVFTREQTKIENKAPMTVISSSNSPLTVSLTLKVESGTLTQAQDVTKNLWIPDRRIEVLTLLPVFSAYDPDSKQNVSILPTYTWYVNGMQVPLTNTSSSDYYIVRQSGEPDMLVIRKNTSYVSPDFVKCVATYADCLHINTMSREAEVTLTTENKPEAVYTVDISATQPIVFRPFSDATPQRAFEAIAQYGNERLHNEVKYFWYADDVLIDESFLGYVSGQGTESIVLDLDFFNDVTLSVKLGVTIYTNDTAQVPTSPNINATAQRLIVWDYENPVLIPIGKGGSAVRSSSGEKQFESVLQVNGKDVSADRVTKYARVFWFTHDTNAAHDDISEKGWGPSLTLTKAEMYRNSSVNVEVGADLYVLGKFKAVVSNEEEQTIVVDNTTGAIVVMND